MPVIPDWYCCLSVALDAEEDEWYNQQYLAYMAAGGDLKKFPKRKRRARRRAANQAPTEPERKNAYDIVTKAIKQSGLPFIGMKGDVNTWASARGLKKVFKTEDGRFVDEEGNLVDAEGSVFVESK